MNENEIMKTTEKEIEFVNKLGELAVKLGVNLNTQLTEFQKQQVKKEIEYAVNLSEIFSKLILWLIGGAK